jgi:hypothetical protein
MAIDTLNAMVGTNIATPVAPHDFQNTAAALVMHVESEQRHPTARMVTAVIVIKCLGGTADYADARDVYLALRHRLHGASGEDVSNGGRIVRAAEVTSYQGGPEPDTGFPSHISKFRVLVTSTSTHVDVIETLRAFLLAA